MRRIFEWYASGKAMGQLAAQLNEEGHRTTNGTLYTRSSFNSILRNEKYIGVYSYGGEVRIEGGCPRIIEDELFFYRAAAAFREQAPAWRIQGRSAVPVKWEAVLRPVRRAHDGHGRHQPHRGAALLLHLQ